MIYIYVYIYICISGFVERWRKELFKIVSSLRIVENTSSSGNNSNQDEGINTSAVLESQDQDILKILVEL